MHWFIAGGFICADPDLNVIRGGGREGSSEVRRRVEGAAVTGAVLSIPECSIVWAITEVVVTNKGRGKGSHSTVSVVTWTAKKSPTMPCSQTPDMLTW